MSVADEESKVGQYAIKNEVVPEKTAAATTNQPLTEKEIEEVQKQRFGGPFGWFLSKLVESGAEARGIERVPENDRKESAGWGQLLFWFSVNLSFTTLGSGMLGSQFFTLSFKSSIAIIYVMSAVGCATTAWIATLGPKYGLRTIALTRFAGGWPGAFIFSLLNIVTQLAYSVTTAIGGAQALHAINSDVPLTAGIVIITAIVFVLCFWGLGVVQFWERYAWGVCMVIIFIILGLGSKGNYQIDALKATQDTGSNLIGDVLSFAGIMFSVSSGWTTIAADYNVNMPANTPKLRTAALTFFGVYIPVTSCGAISAGLMTITNPAYIAAHDNGSLGGLVGKILEPVGGFGKFLLVILMFSTISCNIPNTYSGALCMQTLHPIMMKLPRVIWVTLFTAIYFVAAIAGRESFSEILANVASLLSYWTAFFVVIMALEFCWFRRKGGPLGPIQPDNFNDFSKLPPGYACCGAILMAIGGVIPSMAETYYTGPIALKVATPYGGDLGFEFSAVFSSISYFAFRTFEVKYFKR